MPSALFVFVGISLVIQDPVLEAYYLLLKQEFQSQERAY